MSPKPPGHVDLEDDIEMIGMEDVERTRSPRENGTNTKSYIPVRDTTAEDSDDEEDDDEEEAIQALLGSPHRSRTKKLLDPIGKRWPQVGSIVVESAPTLLLTTVGLLFTGKLLDQVSRWRAMREVHQLIMIIPVVLNLKGNLEMNLSARLGTAANVGELDDPVTRRSMIIGNLSLLQVQATVVSFIAACVALVLGIILPRAAPAQAGTPTNGTDAVVRALVNYRGPIPIPYKDRVNGNSGIHTLIMIASTSMTAACLSSITLGSFMCMLIVLCRKFGRDPDNIAPPVASCLGDLVTLCFIGLISTILIRVIDTPIPFILAILIVVGASFCFIFTIRNHHVRPLLTQGWTPLFGAMIISSGTGIVLDRFVSRYEGFALLAVVISGLPGSVGSILVSRLSTSLHAAALSITPTSARFPQGKNVPPPDTKLVTITLLFVTLPVEIIFLSVIRGLGWLQLPFVFIGLSVVFFFFAVLISLVIARLLTEYLWAKELDPDMYALPVHSALMDLIGQLLLVICFEIVQLLGARVRMKS
ncbi:solute carrier family 41 member 1 [Collybia nuda]|uniref:Solute carrier family 41 member 1 n=1 Tax=Collybia nuda TaxID=64659 RepID=A0A9P6CJP1_9AGAR|nr:solute carrier family 41 member 1 [Collybia nuda]